MLSHKSALILITLLLISKVAMTQFTGNYSNSGEFLDFSHPGQLYVLTEHGSKMSDTRGKFIYGNYKIIKDTLKVLPEKYKLVNIVTYCKNDSADFFKIEYYGQDLFFECNLKLEVFYEDKDSVVVVLLKSIDHKTFYDQNIREILITCDCNTDLWVSYSLTRNELYGHEIEILSIHNNPYMHATQFLISTASVSSIKLKGFPINDYQRFNRRKWFKSFLNWPWEWHFGKEHWYDPIEKEFFLQPCNKKYYFSS